MRAIGLRWGPLRRSNLQFSQKWPQGTPKEPKGPQREAKAGPKDTKGTPKGDRGGVGWGGGGGVFGVWGGWGHQFGIKRIVKTEKDINLDSKG